MPSPKFPATSTVCVSTVTISSFDEFSCGIEGVTAAVVDEALFADGTAPPDAAAAAAADAAAAAAASAAVAVVEADSDEAAAAARLAMASAADDRYGPSRLSSSLGGSGPLLSNVLP